jgi:2-polyprenyl-6-methoxyphenol hydroxylase-like FAD-dependent oxidoreductase
MKVLVSGAGIAGPALALGLARQGAQLTVVDHADRPRPGGQAVDIRGTARGVIDRMALGAAIRAARLDERGLAMVDRRGRRAVEMPAEMFGGEGIVADVEILRGDLAAILLDVTREHVEYRFAERITGLVQDAEGVDVRFAGGGRERYDVVVGADGVHSGVRALAFGPDDAFVRHLGAYTAYFTVPGALYEAAADGPENWFLLYNAPGGRVAGLRPDRDGTAKAYLSFTSPPLPEAELREPRRVVAERMAGAGWRVPELLAALPQADDVVFAAVEQVRVDEWFRGRVVLLGDAGYCGSPLSGHGTSLALVGAYVLAGELGRRPAEPPAAFAAYQAAMRAYVDACTRLPPGGVSAFAPQSRLMIRLRQLSMRSMVRWPMRSILEREFHKGDGMVLPEYELPVGPIGTAHARGGQRSGTV